MINEKLLNEFESNKELYMTQREYLLTNFAYDYVTTPRLDAGISIYPEEGYMSNGREVGPTFTFRANDNHTITLTIYEHRSSDILMVNGKVDAVEGELPYIENCEWDELACFEERDYKGASDLIIKIMANAYTIENDKDLFALARK